VIKRSFRRRTCRRRWSWTLWRGAQRSSKGFVGGTKIDTYSFVCVCFLVGCHILTSCVCTIFSNCRIFSWNPSLWYFSCLTYQILHVHLIFVCYGRCCLICLPRSSVFWLSNVVTVHNGAGSFLLYELSVIFCDRIFFIFRGMP